MCVGVGCSGAEEVGESMGREMGGRRYDSNEGLISS